ncbi:MAG: hypothetical protein NTV34_02710 [Proteobacteria bacterium]|nr:hypothetical protein [Pseudomonadota bacterium]
MLIRSVVTLMAFSLIFSCGKFNKKAEDMLDSTYDEGGFRMVESIKNVVGVKTVTSLKY